MQCLHDVVDAAKEIVGAAEMCVRACSNAVRGVTSVASDSGMAPLYVHGIVLSGIDSAAASRRLAMETDASAVRGYASRDDTSELESAHVMTLNASFATQRPELIRETPAGPGCAGAGCIGPAGAAVLLLSYLHEVADPSATSGTKRLPYQHKSTTKVQNPAE